MKTIWKFPIVLFDVNVIEMPLYADVLTVQDQFGDPMMWALVDPNQITEVRYFEIFGTGQPIPDLDATKKRDYINTFQVNRGHLVFHLFELKRSMESITYTLPTPNTSVRLGEF